jgi:tellurium resistance protein TerD
MEKRPQLNRIQIGVGWDQRNMEAEPIDLDAVVFLLNKDEQTREDEDFVFYNQMVTLDGAVKHEGDNRTGAGDGDDEVISIDLNGVPFDIMKIMIVLSVYDQDMKGHHIQMTKNIFVRLVDNEDRDEIIRFNIPEEDISTATAIRMAALVREGPKWFFEPIAEPVVGGLGKVAKGYGLIIQELASTSEDF